jgi:putative ABC transport system substrate-binding protein
LGWEGFPLPVQRSDRDNLHTCKLWLEGIVANRRVGRIGPGAGVGEGEEPGSTGGDEGHRGITGQPARARAMIPMSREEYRYYHNRRIAWPQRFCGVTSCSRPAERENSAHRHYWVSGQCSALRTNMQSFIAGLHDRGYEDGRNIQLEFRSPEGNLDRLPSIAAELVSLKVDALVTTVCGALLDTARRATSTIPIVVATCSDDMVEMGIISSMAHPGGNVTGLSKMSPELEGKRLELLKVVVPAASHVAVLWDPQYSAYVADWQELQAAAHAEGVALHPVRAHVPADLDQAFAAMVRERVDGALSLPDAMTYGVPNRVAELAAESKMPLVSPFSEITKAGGLMSYGPSIPDLLWRAAGYVDKILKGTNPGDLPVEQPTKFELVINLTTAKALGLSIPATLLARADEVIE